MADHPTDVFADDVGVWDAEMEIFPSPGAAPVRMTAVSTNRRICGGRWLVVDFVAASGFEGHGVYGWDDAAGKYVGTWVDTTRTSIGRAEGTWDPATRTMTFVTRAVQEGRTLLTREVTRTVDDGTRTYSNFVTLTEGEHEMIRTTYRRRA